MQVWVIGNWKQNPATNHEVNQLLDTLLTRTGLTRADTDKNITTACQLMVAPSSVHLTAVSQRLQGSHILCAAQDISAHSASTGAYTGDCSAQQVADAGATWTILGHSERRQYHRESHDSLVHKINNALAQDLGVVLCVGETQAQYDAQQTLAVLEQQLTVIKEVLATQSTLPKPQSDPTQNRIARLAGRLIIAYEPVWAIGTGKVPTVDEVSATHAYIKQTLAHFEPTLMNTSVLYGGSVNADNAASFAASPVIDGALVGGAALKAESFLAIATAFGAVQV